MGTLYNVVDSFGVRNDGTDTTSQMALTYASTSAGDGLFFPTGTYLFDSDAIAMASRLIYGESRLGTVFKARTAGAFLFKLFGSGAAVENVTFDADGKAGNALWAPMAGGYVRHVLATNALSWAVLWDNCSVDAADVIARDSALGQRLLGPNGSTFRKLVTQNCVGTGFRFDGGAAVPQETTQSGQCQVFGLFCDGCGTDGASPQVAMFGSEVVFIFGGRIAWLTPTDGLLVAQDTHNCSFGALRLEYAATPGDMTKAVRLTNSEMNTFRGISVNQVGDAKAEFYADSPASFGANRFYACWQRSGATYARMPLTVTDGATTESYVTGDGDLMNNGTMPTLGRWIQGTRIRKYDAPSGITCTVGGTGPAATWVAGL